MTIERISDAKTEKLKNNSVSEDSVDNSPKTVEKNIPSLAPKAKVNGGARPGAGRKKGRMNKSTVEKMKIKKELEDRIAKHAQKMLTAQLSVALGSQYLFWRYKIKTPKGERWSKFERIDDPEVMMQYLDGELNNKSAEYYMLTADKPDVGTIESMFDRAFGKAPQSLKIEDDRPDPIAAILAKFGLLEEEGNSNDRQTQTTSETSS